MLEGDMAEGMKPRFRPWWSLKVHPLTAVIRCTFSVPAQKWNYLDRVFKSDFHKDNSNEHLYEELAFNMTMLC